jgi:cytoskeletal protein CcmA (bactofilin family)
MLSALNKSPSEKPCNTIDTLIGAKTEIKGDIVFSGGLRIDGKIKGNILAKGEGNSTLVLSEHAVVIGNVTVPHIISNGTIKGNVRANERIELQPKAEIAGDIYYKVIEMALGAVINGNLVRELNPPATAAASSSEAGKTAATVTRFKSLASAGSEEENG